MPLPLAGDASAGLAALGGPAIGTYDIVVAVVICAGWWRGRTKGFVWQLSSIATVVCGFLLASAFSRRLAPALGLEPPFDRFVAWIVIFALVAIAIYLLALRWKKELERLEMDELDRRFGGFLGGLKALVFLAILTLVSVGLSEGLRDHVLGSYSGRGVGRVASTLRVLLPERLDTALGAYFERLAPITSPPAPLAPPYAAPDDDAPLAGARPTPVGAGPTGAGRAPRPGPSPAGAETPPSGPAATPSPRAPSPAAPWEARRPPGDPVDDWEEYLRQLDAASQPEEGAEAPRDPLAAPTPQVPDTSRTGRDPLAPPPRTR